MLKADAPPRWCTALCRLLLVSLSCLSGARCWEVPSVNSTWSIAGANNVKLLSIAKPGGIGERSGSCALHLILQSTCMPALKGTLRAHVDRAPYVCCCPSGRRGEIRGQAAQCPGRRGAGAGGQEPAAEHPGLRRELRPAGPLQRVQLVVCRAAVP
jgi:hypothetical protein